MHSMRQLVVFGPDYAEIGGDVIVLTEGNRLGIIPQGERSWGMSSDVLQVGNSKAFYSMVRPGSMKFESPSDPSDVTLFFPVRGSTLIEIENGDELEVHSNSAFFYLSGVRGKASWPVESTFVGVCVPEEILAEMGVEPDLTFGLLEVGSFLSTPAVNFLKSVALNDSNATALSAYFIEKLMQELVGSFFLSHACLASEPVLDRAHLYQTAVSVITAKRADPALSSRSVAADLNISLRQLQREFRTRGVSPAELIRKLRAELAVQHLQNRAYDALSIEQIAKYCGLSSSQQLRSALAATGHPTPRRIREISALSSGQAGTE